MIGLLLIAGCGGGSGSEPPAGTGDQQTAQELFRDCLESDAVDVASLLGALQTVFANDAGALPQPEFNLLAALFNGGVVPYTWDLDADGAAELSGTVRFLDESGATTIPFDVLEVLASGLDDPLDLIAQAPDGTRLELAFTLGGALLDPAGDASGDGVLRFGIVDGAIATASGEGTFETGPCLLDFSFDGVPVADLTAIPEAGFEFDARIGEDVLAGTIDFDGTGTATVTARLNDEAEQVFEIAIPAPPADS